MNAPPKKILVVDDDQSAVAFVRAALESEKYEVAGAVDGLAGLSQVRKDPPDLIILDRRIHASPAGILYTSGSKRRPENQNHSGYHAYQRWQATWYNLFYSRHLRFPGNRTRCFSRKAGGPNVLTKGNRQALGNGLC
ncbi:MAG: response regulator transcription factor [Planctomycetota bacterium]